MIKWILDNTTVTDRILSLLLPNSFNVSSMHFNADLVCSTMSVVYVRKRNRNERRGEKRRREKVKKRMRKHDGDDRCGDCVVLVIGWCCMIMYERMGEEGGR